MRKTSLSVVIITYNSASEITSCLNALLSIKSHLLNDIVVVDNASTDDTRALVSQYPGVRLIGHGANKGFAAAVNSGVRRTSADYVLVLNPDVVFASEALEALVNVLSEHKEYAAVSCRMVFPDGRRQVSARRFPTVATFLARVLLTNSIARRFHVSKEPGNYPELIEQRLRKGAITQVDWILGACMMIRRSAYDIIGPLDEKYFLYYEDTDWCYRANLAKWRIGYLEDSQVIHEHKRTSSHLSLKNRLMWIHLSSACRFLTKFAGTRGMRTVF